MMDAKVPGRAAGIGRLGTAAAWISALCCLPYLVLKVVWTLDIPVGITDRSVLDSKGWAAANALMAAMQLAALLLVLALTRPWAFKMPAWLVLFPAWVGTGLLFEVAVGAVLVGLTSAASESSAESTTEIQSWVFVMVYSAFAGQGAALAIAFASHVRARWGGLLGTSTSDVLTTPAGGARSSPDHHLTEAAEVVAGMAVVVALACGYWAAGGSFGLSSSQPRPPFGMHAARIAGAVLAVVGLLCLAGRWGHRTTFWLPAALVWVGSGALAAFDGLNLVVTRLFLILGADESDAGWSLIDTVLAAKVVIGVCAAAVGALALTAAAANTRVRISDRAGV